MKTLHLAIIAILTVILVVGSNTIFAQPETMLSPLRQLKSGIQAQDIQCETGFELILKSQDGSPACVTPDTANILIERGWARNPLVKLPVLSEKTFPSETSSGKNTTSSQNSTLHVSFEPCDTPFPQSNTGIVVLYMPANSIGKICVRYSNFNDFPAPLGIRASNANNMNQNATEITTWNELGNRTTIPKGNSTVVYWIKTGNQTGLYALTIFCSGMPFAVGYDNQSNITVNDLPWVNKITACPLMSYQYNIVGLSNIGIWYVPNP
ncbi:MAG: hypothetical protein WAN47_08230 [Nitrosotalea sp.]